MVRKDTDGRLGNLNFEDRLVLELGMLITYDKLLVTHKLRCQESGTMGNFLARNNSVTYFHGAWKVFREKLFDERARRLATS